MQNRSAQGFFRQTASRLQVPAPGLPGNDVARQHEAKISYAVLNELKTNIAYHCRHSYLGEAASSIRSDMIFGKDTDTP
jgi:hypothetical protein